MLNYKVSVRTARLTKKVLEVKARNESHLRERCNELNPNGCILDFEVITPKYFIPNHI